MEEVHFAQRSLSSVVECRHNTAVNIEHVHPSQQCPASSACRHQDTERTQIKERKTAISRMAHLYHIYVYITCKSLKQLHKPSWGVCVNQHLQYWSLPSIPTAPVQRSHDPGHMQGAEESWEKSSGSWQYLSVTNSPISYISLTWIFHRSPHFVTCQDFL